MTPDQPTEAVIPPPINDTYPALRRRVALALGRPRRKRQTNVAEGQALRLADAEALVQQADMLFLLQCEIRKAVESSGVPFTGVIREIQLALADRALLNRVERADVTIAPFSYDPAVEGEARVVSSWLVRPDAHHDIEYQRPHRHLREALYEALAAPLDRFVPAMDEVPT